MAKFTLLQNSFHLGTEFWTYGSGNQAVCFFPYPSENSDVDDFLSHASSCLASSRKFETAIVIDSRCDNLMWRHTIALPKLSAFIAQKRKKCVSVVLFCCICDEAFDSEEMCTSCELSLETGHVLTQIEVNHEWVNIATNFLC